MAVFLEALAGRGGKDPAASVKSETKKYKVLLIVPSPDSFRGHVNAIPPSTSPRTHQAPEQLQKSSGTEAPIWSLAAREQGPLEAAFQLILSASSMSTRTR
ncbi:hypothetical protein MPDQ_000800 [Monascus purpureus]|uniref:Uncharacterized protein n=1 Tax=Monascus purpureus TaxID=5098 RepID=A0A507QT51_MONPU|nr:hypothetical protein MPDQ_000800 [Monascus purpureus]